MTGRHLGAAVLVSLFAATTAGCSADASNNTEAAPSLTFEEQAAGRAALTVFESAQEVASLAWADPTQDWTTEVEQVAADPYRSALLADLEAAGRNDTAAYASTLTTTNPTVVDVNLANGTVTLTDCLNGTAVDAQVGRAADGRWLVTEHTTNPDQTC